MLQVNDEVQETFCCFSCKTRPLILQASIPFSGYVPSQCIRITVKINNKCGFDVTRTVISLKKIFTSVSEIPERREWSESKTLVKIVVDGAKSGKDTKIFGVLEIPKFTLPTNDLSNIIKVSYVITISLDVVGFFYSPKVTLPIVIGSKPLKFENKMRF